MDVKRLHQMKPLEMICFNSNTSWLRVPGGWVYGDLQGCCFVPYNNEFDKKPDATPLPSYSKQIRGNF